MSRFEFFPLSRIICIWDLYLSSPLSISQPKTPALTSPSSRHLLQTLQSLTTLSASTTRRLDYTYYSLLEHTSHLVTLTSTLSSLASTTSVHSATFLNSTSSLTTSLGTQISGFGTTFAAQESRIGVLEQKLVEGRSRVRVLGTRLEEVRRQVEGWERGEGEWEGRVRWRLRMLWGAVGVAVGFFLVGLVVRHWPAHGGGGERGLLVSGGNGSLLSPGEDAAGADIIIPAPEERGNNTPPPQPQSETAPANPPSQSTPAAALTMEQDPRLDLFDEL